MGFLGLEPLNLTSLSLVMMWPQLLAQLLLPREESCDLVRFKDLVHGCASIL